MERKSPSVDKSLAAQGLSMREVNGQFPRQVSAKNEEENDIFHKSRGRNGSQVTVHRLFLQEGRR